MADMTSVAVSLSHEILLFGIVNRYIKDDLIVIHPLNEFLQCKTHKKHGPNLKAT
jgi:hypothetical protein